MAPRYVHGVYNNYADAESQANDIVSKGIPKSSISLVSNESASTEAQTDYHYVQADNVNDDRNWFQKLFSLEDEGNNENIDYSQYEDSLNNGEVLVVVDSEYEGALTDFNADFTSTGRPVPGSADGFAAGTNASSNPDPDLATTQADLKDNDIAGRDTAYDPSLNNTNTNADRANLQADTDKENVKLHEEELDVSTRKKDVGDVEITKEVVEDTETVEVPVEREELHIKHKTPTQRDADPESDAFQEEEYTVPLSEEEVVVDKDTVVRDEVEIEKRTEVDQEEVTETTRREELEIEDGARRTKEEFNKKDNTNRP